MKYNKIKNLKPRLKTKRQPFKQGYFDIHNPKKYLGPRPIIYRSSWELQYMLWLENNSNVMSWSSESFGITYYDRKGGSHKYYADFMQTMKDGTVWLIEVKPKKDIPRNALDLKDPVKAQNYLKWNAAKKYCEVNKNMKFAIITEDFIKNIK